MSTKSRDVIYGGQIIGARIRAQGALEAAKKAVREADREARQTTPYRWAHPDDDDRR